MWNGWTRNLGARGLANHTGGWRQPRGSTILSDIASKSALQAERELRKFRGFRVCDYLNYGRTADQKPIEQPRSVTNVLVQDVSPG